MKYFILSAIALVSNICHAQDKTSKEIPKGIIEIFQFTESKIFPGTMREVAVYIPQQMDPSATACVYVQQDGYYPASGFNDVLDTLIANKEIPVMVGIFIKPGNLPSANKNTLARPNRCFEYDAVDDSYARFLLEEILPTVASKYKLNLSNNGNDRCIGGVSSGGISAFNVAWLRPDAFSRVYCISGSFVGFRGGHEFPTLLRKTEAKPIRAFLTTGSNDMENCAGDWTLLDMEMDKALKFSGYDYQFTFIKNGYHGSGWKELFANGMRYLWKNWPTAVKAGPSAPRVQDIIIPGEPWQLVSGKFNNAHGPACNSKGDVFFIDAPNNKIFKITPDGIKEFISDAAHNNALTVGADDGLYAVSALTGKIMKYDATGKGTLYAKNVPGEYILARPDGGLYVSGGDHGIVWMVNKDKKTVVDSGMKFSTGIAMSPDQWLLTLADGHSHWVYSYQIAPDGSLINKERFFWLHVQDWAEDSGAESVCYDKEGHLYVATRFGIQICAWDGPTQVILPLPKGERVTGICFGGADLNTLFAFSGDKIYKRKIKNHALGAFTPWIKMTQGSL